VWRLGGKHSSFKVDADARFRWQHDARAHGSSEVSVFDNNAVRRTPGAVTHGLVIHLDRQAHTASLVRSYTHPEGIQSPSQGNLQLLPDGHAVMGWGGSNNRFSEFAPDGTLLFDATFTTANDSSYRAFRFPWTGHPGDAPAAAATSSAGATTVYASWNGATEVAKWRVGSVTVARTGFETAIPVSGTPQQVRVEALDGAGHVIGRSAPVAVKSA
jgi:hypothetical protein